MNKKGFTLVELITVIIIIGIISVITIPNIMKALTTSKNSNGESVEKLLENNLELYNMDYKEDLWCLDQSDRESDYCKYTLNENNVIVSKREPENSDTPKITVTKSIGVENLYAINPDIDLGECLLKGDNPLKITMEETQTKDDEGIIKSKYKYSYSASIVCSSDFKESANVTKIADEEQLKNKNIYYSSEN